MLDAPTAQGRATGASALRADHGGEMRAVYEGALRFANRLRRMDGRERSDQLASGDRGDCSGCPIAATANIGARKDVARWEVGDGGAIKVTLGGAVKGDPVPLTPTALGFMAAFDSGAFPELDAAAAIA